MKLFNRFLLALLLAGAAAQAQKKTSAAQIIAEAKTTAAKEHKNIFIIFHASWCGWCHKMDTAMNDASCKALFDKQYVIRHIDVMEHGDKKVLENPGGEELLKAHGGGDGIPFWYVTDSKGQLLADSRKTGPDGRKANVGCPSTPDEIEHFLEVLKKTSTLSTSELATIQKRFSAK